MTDLLENWLKYDRDPKSQAQIKTLAESNPGDFQKSMQPRISFGTAGLRAEMGPGFARMNSVTVTQTSQGLAQYVKQTVTNALSRGVVVGYDHRHNSKSFADDIVRTFAHLGYKIHLLGLVHTPMIPFAIRKLGASCGIMVTASHNPAKDNGYKVYWENACQIISPHDANISKAILSELDIWDSSSVDAPTTHLFDDYERTVLDPLVESTLANAPSIVYTPVHGVGWVPAEAAFKKLGISAHVVPEQAQPDPDFPTVSFPNPEEKGALDLAMRFADKIDSKIVLANDPDADRFSVAVNESGWRQLTGDQIGVLFADYILKKTANSGKPVAVVNSAVSSQQLARQAEMFNAKYFEVLTGFKWIGNKAIDLDEKEGYSVPFAYEEAIGYMLSEYIRDKDGISALVVFAQLLYKIYKEGKTVWGELDRISKETGYFATHNAYYTVASPSITTSTFEEIRKKSKTQIGDLQVTSWRDLTIGYDSTQPDKKPTLPVSPSSEMLTVGLKFSGNETARFTARGSGTEPKLKVYIEASADSESAAQRAADYVWDLLAKEWFAELQPK